MKNRWEYLFLLMENMAYWMELEKSMKLNEGEIAYTSGISHIYPSNIPVAKVISVNKNTNSPFQDVNVEILTDLNDFNYVFCGSTNDNKLF